MRRPGNYLAALSHESSLARTRPTDGILTCRCDTTLVGAEPILRPPSSQTGRRVLVAHLPTGNVASSSAVAARRSSRPAFSALPFGLGTSAWTVP